MPAWEVQRLDSFTRSWVAVVQFDNRSPTTAWNEIEVPAGTRAAAKWRLIAKAEPSSGWVHVTALEMIASAPLPRVNIVEWDYTNIDVQPTAFGAITGGAPIHESVAELGHPGTSIYTPGMKHYPTGGWWQLFAKTPPVGSSFSWKEPSKDFTSGFQTDFGQVLKLTHAQIGKASTHGDITVFRIQRSLDGENWTPLNLTGTVATGKTTKKDNGLTGGGDLSKFDDTGVMRWSAMVPQPAQAVTYNLAFGTAFEARYIRMEIGDWQRYTTPDNPGWSRWRWWYDNNYEHCAVAACWDRDYTGEKPCNSTTITTTTTTATTTTPTPTCSAEFKPSILDVQTSSLTAQDWRIKPTQKMLNIGYTNGWKRYTVGNGTMSLDSGLQDEFLRTEPFGLESGELSFEVQVDTYTHIKNWLRVGIGTELEGDLFDTKWYSTRNTVSFYQGDMQLSYTSPHVDGRIYGGIHVLDSPISATAKYVMRNVPATSGKPRRYKLGRNKNDKLTASIAYFDSATNTFGDYKLLYTSTAVTQGQLYLMIGGTGGNGWTASRLQKTIQTVVPVEVCPNSRPTKPFASTCVDTTCTINECCIATCDRESDCSDENSACQSELKLPAAFCAMHECDGKGASVTKFSALTPVGAAGSIDGAHHVAAADIDGDGNMDLVSAAQLDGSVAWFKGSGSGNTKTFGAKQLIVDGLNGVRCVVAVDFNGDGHVDIASASQRANKVEVYLNNNGTGTAWTTVTVDNDIPGAVFVVAADLDGDGLTDLASAAYTPADSNTQGSTNDRISFYKGNGDGTFGKKQVVSDVGRGYTSVAAADIDGDGRVDMASTSYHDASTQWYKNLGGGQFGSGANVDDPGSTKGAYDVKLADLDADGLIDIVVAADAMNVVAWHKNLGGGAFGARQMLSSQANGAMSVSVADINGDGLVDVVCAGYKDDTVQWFENRGRGKFGSAQVVTTSANQVSYVIAVDLDGDGVVDLASASFVDDQIEWYRNLGSTYADKTATSGRCILKPSAGVDGIVGFCGANPEEPFCFPTCSSLDANNCQNGTTITDDVVTKCGSAKCAAAECCLANPPCTGDISAGKGVADVLSGAQNAGNCVAGGVVTLPGALPALPAASSCLQTAAAGYTCTETRCANAGTVLQLGECTANSPCDASLLLTNAVATNNCTSTLVAGSACRQTPAKGHACTSTTCATDSFLTLGVCSQVVIETDGNNGGDNGGGGDDTPTMAVTTQPISTNLTTTIAAGAGRDGSDKGDDGKGVQI